MALQRAQKKELYSYADYLTWGDDVKGELVEGEFIAMSPAPTTRHQKISMALSLKIGYFLKNKPCQVFSAPFDVRLLEATNDNSIFTVVQPDLSVICDSSKIDERGCVGAPDFVIEITSPGRAYYDVQVKRDLYERAGVLEYWVVDSSEEMVTVYLLQNKEIQNKNNSKQKVYGKGQVYGIKDSIACEVLTGLKIRLKDIFK